MSLFARREESLVTIDSTVEPGFLFASFKNTGAYNVFVDGVSLKPGEAKSYPFVGKAYGDPVSYELLGNSLQVLIIY